MLFSAPVFALEKVILQLAWKHQFEFAGFYAAKAHGYYKQAGLDVQIKELTAETDILQDVLSANATYGIASAQIVIDRLRGYPVVLLASYFKQNALALVADKSIKVPHDLIGKRVMVEKGELENTALALMLQEQHIPVDKIIQVPHQYNPQDFIEGKVDAMSIFVSNQLYDIELSGVAYNVFNPAEFGIYSLDFNLFSSEAEVIAHPERIQRFLDASKKGWQYALANKEEIVDLILAQYSAQKSKAALLFEAQKSEELIKPSLYDIGSISPEILEFTRKMFNRLYNLPNSQLGEGFIFSLRQQRNQELQLTEEEYQYLQQKRELKLCVDPDWMPYQKIDKKGKFVGMSADFLALLIKKINIPITLVPSNVRLQSLQTGSQSQCDIYSLVIDTQMHEGQPYFTRPYLRFPLVIATRYEQIFIADIESVLNEKLGIQKGYAYADVLRQKYPQINLIEVDSLEDGLESVRQKKLYAMIDALPSIAYASQRAFMGEIKIAGKLDENWELRAGVRNDEPLLVSILNKSIAQVSQNERQDIRNRWIAVKYDLGTDYALLIRVLLVLAVMFAFFLYHHLQLKKYNRRLTQLSLTDKLTNISNRIKLDQQLEKALYYAQRYQQPFGIMLLDMDYFKSVNDNYGHLVGDYVLQVIAGLLKKNIRIADTVGRWGGEEFLIICPEQTAEGVRLLAEKIRIMIADYPFEHALKLSCSIGVSSYQPDDNSDTLIKRADDALYKAKAQGRNCVCVD